MIFKILSFCSPKKLFKKKCVDSVKPIIMEPESTTYDELKRMNRQLSALKQLVHDDLIENMPQWISFQTTYVCNLKCPHCQTHGTEEGRFDCNDRKRDMPEEMLREVGREVLPIADEFTLSLSGEPLASPHLASTLSELSRYGAKLDLITNGTLLKRETLGVVLPIAGRIQISIDGATEFTLEAIRRGAKFKTLINNIKLLTETVNLLPDPLKPEITFSFTVMGSNIRELPEIVRLAAFCGVRIINGAFVEVFYDYLEHERVGHHKAFYNFYRGEALELAENIGITLKLPKAFEGIEPDRKTIPCRKLMIVEKVPENYYDVLPPPEKYIDWDRLKKDSEVLAAHLLSRRHAAVHAKINVSDKNDLLCAGTSDLSDMVHKRDKLLQKIILKKGKKIKFCDYLYRCIYISPVGEVTPCCIVGSPILGNVKKNTVREIWNGSEYNEFRRRFFSEHPSECCKDCKFLQYRPVEDFSSECLTPYQE